MRPADERPFKIYDEELLRDLPWRAYSTERRAITKALELAYWDLKPTKAYTVYDRRSSRVIRQFVRRANGIIEEYK